MVRTLPSREVPVFRPLSFCYVHNFLGIGPDPQGPVVEEVMLEVTGHSYGSEDIFACE